MKVDRLLRELAFHRVSDPLVDRRHDYIYESKKAGALKREIKEVNGEMMLNKSTLDFYRGKKVFVTGSTGFKASWLIHILLNIGAIVTGYALEPPTDPALFCVIGLDQDARLNQHYSDIRNLDKLKNSFEASQPEIVFHLAAQPIVRDSFRNPVNTYSTNVMGTVNVCECVRQTDSVRSFLNVTTDKVYKNNEWEWGYRETDVLGGLDPYSNSKSCSELITHSFYESYFTDGRVGVSTARAGNVIGGGDFSNDRIVPDCVRALQSDGIISVRNPNSIRPYEHVLEPLFAYLMIAKAQYEDVSYASCYNVGPDDQDCVSTGNLVTLFCDIWNEKAFGVKASWVNKAEENRLYEANFLKLDCSKLKNVFGWRPHWHIDETIRQTVNWTKVWMDGGDRDAICEEMDREIELFFI